MAGNPDTRISAKPEDIVRNTGWGFLISSPPIDKEGNTIIAEFNQIATSDSNVRPMLSILGTATAENNTSS